LFCSVSFFFPLLLCFFILFYFLLQVMCLTMGVMVYCSLSNMVCISLCFAFFHLFCILPSSFRSRRHMSPHSSLHNQRGRRKKKFWG
jgi:hypothetical protein